jgi:hypothetical protein
MLPQFKLHAAVMAVVAFTEGKASVAPGDRVLVSADSHPPVPVPEKMKGVPASVWNTYLRGTCTARRR